MSAQGAAPGTGIPGQRQDLEGNAEQHSALILVRNSISTEPKDYDALQFDVRETRPRLLPEAVDHALTRLIQQRAVWLSGDCRWTARR